MCDDGEPPAKQSKCNLRSYSEPQMEVPISETLTATTLVDLNEDCLNEIFGHLNVIALCYVSRVCKRLQELAKSYFKGQYRKFNFSKLFQGRLISKQEARDVLSMFGPMITSMSIQRETFYNHEAVGHVEVRILNDVAKYCSKELITLRLTGFNFTSRAVEALNLFSGSLTELTLGGTLHDSVSANCVFHLINLLALTRLTLTYSSDCYVLMGTFPNLKYLKLHNVVNPSQYLLHHFIVSHSQLETLIITYSVGVSSTVIRSVAKYVKNLREFHFYRSSIYDYESREETKENFLQLSELRNLEKLMLRCSYLSIGNVLAKMVTNKIALKTLHIWEGLNDAQTMNAIVQMKYLEELYFCHMKNLNGEHLIKCAKELTRLKRLSINLDKNITAVALKEVLRHTKQLVHLGIHHRNFLLDSGLYNEILNIVKERRNGTKLGINFDSVNILVPKGTIHANENWLTIKKT